MYEHFMPRSPSLTNLFLTSVNILGGNFCLTFWKTISGYLSQITPINMQLPVRMSPRNFCIVFPRFGTPGRLPTFRVYRVALNKAGALTRIGVLTKTCHNVRLAIFRIVRSIKIFCLAVMLSWQSRLIKCLIIVLTLREDKQASKTAIEFALLSF